MRISAHGLAHAIQILLEEAADNAAADILLPGPLVGQIGLMGDRNEAVLSVDFGGNDTFQIRVIRYRGVEEDLPG